MKKNMSQLTLFDEITACALALYKSLPDSGKPLSSEIFTVFASFVAVIKIDGESKNECENNNKPPTLKAISCATGTKCVGEDQIDNDGMILHDSHAEVLARRGLVRYLSLWLLKAMHFPACEEEVLCPIEKSTICNPCNSRSASPYRIKKSWKFYLYISDSPCGDATIYPSAITGQDTFTGAKLVKPIEGILINDTGHCLREAGEQSVGALRTKCGRSDITHRSNAMSCSDKLCRWIILGLQGGALYRFLGKVQLSGVIVGADPGAMSMEHQYEALNRALLTRWQSNNNHNNNDDRHSLLQEEEELALPVCAIITKPEYQFTFSKSILKYQSNQNHRVQVQEVETITEGEDMLPKAKKARKACNSNGNDINSSSVILPCGNSLNWQLHVGFLMKQQQHHQFPSEYYDLLEGGKHSKGKPCVQGSVEVTIAQTGLPQGMNQKSLQQQRDKSQQQQKQQIVGFRQSWYKFTSRLSRYQLQDVLMELSRKISSSNKEIIEQEQEGTKENSTGSAALSYEEWKESQLTPAYQARKDAFFRHPLFEHWMR